MRFIALYLPQFHPIPENDVWWGKGFTDWVNVRKAVPRFAGHYQPHVPSELGYYDLRDPAVMERQAELATSHGIDAFCFYHYWFNGKRLLHQPIDAFLSRKSPDFPFCLCWANENWTRAWDGGSREILLAQNHTLQDRREHIAWLLRIFADRRYVLIDGKPLFLVYRPEIIPGVSDMIAEWQATARRHGLPGLYLCVVRNSFPLGDNTGNPECGFDATVDFQPNHQESLSRPQEVKRKLWRVVYSLLSKGLGGGFQTKTRYFSSVIASYDSFAKRATARIASSTDRTFPCVFPSWDNSARKEKAHIIQNMDPASFGAWLGSAAEYVEQKLSGDERIVFINAWNEWAEGCHLEPDEKMGRAFLEEVLRVRKRFLS